jgi:hemin uptake protein HemP
MMLFRFLATTTMTTSDAKSSKKTLLMAKEQDAPLLSQLPAELRQMISETYFRGHAVHLYIERKQLRANECLKMRCR